MLLFPKVVLLAGVATGITAVIFFFRPTPDLSVAQLTPGESEQLRNQIRHLEDDSGAMALPDNHVRPTAASANPGQYQFKSGLTPQELQALREQVRGVMPDLRLGVVGGQPESVAVNESYPDGVSIPVNDTGSVAGRTR